MSFRSKGTVGPTVVVSVLPDRSGNFVCTGAADDVEIQAAIAYLVNSYGGGIVKVRDGTYHMESQTLIPTDISIIGDGVGTRFEKDFDGTELFEISDANEGQVLSNFCIDGNRGTPHTGTGIQVTGVSRDVLIDNVRVIQCEEYGIEVYNSWGTVIKDCLIEYCGDGIYKYGTGNATLIDGCASRYNDRHAIYFDGGDRHRVINCIIEKSQEEYGCGIRADEGDFITIVNNNFEDFPANGRCVYIAGTAAPCYGTKITHNYMSENYRLIDLNFSVDALIRDNSLNGTGIGIYVNANANTTYIYYNDFNCTTYLSDNGTDTATPHVFSEVTDQDTLLGRHPAIILPDTVDTSVFFQFYVPLEFQDLVTAHIIVAQTTTGGPPNMQWSTNVHNGKICVGEDYDAHGDSQTDQTTAVTQDNLVCIDVSPSLTYIDAGDLVGFTFIRRASQGGDTINADAYYLGFRMRYI